MSEKDRPNLSQAAVGEHARFGVDAVKRCRANGDAKALRL